MFERYISSDVQATHQTKIGEEREGGAYVCLYSPVVSPVFSRSVAKNYERDYSKKLCSNGKKGMTEPLQRHGY